MKTYLFLLFLPLFIYSKHMKQKVVLISGCSSGIGFHTAVHLSNQNYKVYAGVLDPQHDALSLQTATTNPSSLIPVKLDITKKEDIRSIIQRISFFKRRPWAL